MQVQSSFRDPSGYLFFNNGVLYRNINKDYKKHFDVLMQSKLYEHLTTHNLLIKHTDASETLLHENSYKTIQPELIPFISYPYEWSFSQLKDAALLTLQIQSIALSYGMQLKDASAYNIQFKHGKPIFIDTLSFEIYEPGKPWVAYKQFCQHFLAPLALMAHTNIDLNKLLQLYIDGIPLNLASQLLPLKTHLKLSLKLHIHIHAKTQKKYEDKTDVHKKHKPFSLTALKGLIDNLTCTIKKLHWKPQGTEWAEYYNDDSYTEKALESKKHIVSSCLSSIHPKNVWDLGGNDGTFSRIAEQNGASVICFDIDPASIEKNYLHVKKHNSRILPLLLDLTNPSPSIGFNNNERNAIIQRGPTDVIMALALIHHLAISNNVPLHFIASFFSTLCTYAIVEFVPKEDKKVRKLLATRKDVFPNYTETGFEEAFSTYFTINQKIPIEGSKRILYLMEKKA